MKRLFTKLMEVANKVLSAGEIKSLFPGFVVKDYSSSGSIQFTFTKEENNTKLYCVINGTYYTKDKYQGKDCAITVSMYVSLKEHNIAPFSFEVYEKNKERFAHLDKLFNNTMSSLGFKSNGGAMSFLAPGGKRTTFGGMWIKLVNTDELSHIAPKLVQLANSVK